MRWRCCTPCRWRHGGGFPGPCWGSVWSAGWPSRPLAAPIVLGPASLVAVYSVAADGGRWVSLAGLAVAEVSLAAVQLTPGRHQVVTLVVDMLVVAAAWLLGHFVGDRRVSAARLEDRTAELEQAREELARRAPAEERLHLARELHDVVADAMSVIAVQSGVGAPCRRQPARGGGQGPGGHRGHQPGRPHRVAAFASPLEGAVPADLGCLRGIP
jgi:Histidine kinase